jgi:hypothetical protein
MKVFRPSSISNAFVFAIKEPFAHIGNVLLAFLVSIFLQIVVSIAAFLCLLLPMSGIAFYVVGYKTNIFANAIGLSSGIMPIFSVMWLIIGWLCFYRLMYDKKQLHTYVFLLSPKLFAKACLLLPLTLPTWLILSPHLIMTLIQRSFNLINISFIAMLFMSTLSTLVVLYWAIVGQFALLEIIGGTPTKDAIRNAFHLTHHNLFTVLLYEAVIATITAAFFILLLRLSLFSTSLLPLIAAWLISYYFAVVIIPASLVFLYRRLKETKPSFA